MIHKAYCKLKKHWQRELHDILTEEFQWDIRYYTFLITQIQLCNFNNTIISTA